MAQLIADNLYCYITATTFDDLPTTIAGAIGTHASETDINKEYLKKAIMEMMPEIMKEFCPCYHKKRILLIEKFKNIK